jgi:nicotinamidase/pyrazinamidase
VDVQRDFCAGGALAVPDGDAVVPVLNDWIAQARRGGAQVVFSRDWHPPDHCSFRSQGGPWPPHCIQGTEGAAFHPKLQVPQDAWIVSKGMDRDREQYSALDCTDLAQRLKGLGVRRLWVGGLALDYCVRASALDAAGAGFEVHLLTSATRPVDPQRASQVLAQMEAAGVRLEDAAETVSLRRGTSRGASG